MDRIGFGVRRRSVVLERILKININVPRNQESQLNETYPNPTVVVVPRGWWHRESIFRVGIGVHRIGQRDAVGRPVGTFHAKFHQGDGQCHQQATYEDVEYSGNVAQGEFVSGGILFVTVLAFGSVVPPFVNQLGQFAVFLQRQHCQVDGVSVGGNNGRLI